MNLSKDHKLQAVFNTNTLVEKTVSEDLFGTVERTFNPNYDLNEQIPAPRGIELKTNNMPINRFVLANGVGIISDGLKDVEVFGTTLALTLIRAVGIISNPKNASRGTPAGPPLEAPDMQMLGSQKAHFAVSFVKSAKELYPVCDKIFNPPVIFFGKTQNKNFISQDNGNIRISAIKQAEDKSLVVRLFNLSDEKEVCNFSCNKLKLYETNLTEDKDIPTNNVLYFNPKEIKTVKLK